MALTTFCLLLSFFTCRVVAPYYGFFFLPLPMRRYSYGESLCCLEVSTLPLSTWREIGKLRLTSLATLEPSRIVSKQMKNAWKKETRTRELKERKLISSPSAPRHFIVYTVPTWTWSTVRVPLATCWMKSTTCSTRKRNWRSVCQQCGAAAVPFQFFFNNPPVVL